MSTPKLCPGGKSWADGNIYIYIDTSNLWVGGWKAHANECQITAPDNLGWQYSPSALKDILTDNCSLWPNEQDFHTIITLYGPTPRNQLWEAILPCSVKIKHREISEEREKKVNAQIITDFVDDAVSAFHTKIPSEFVIVSGNSSLQPAIRKMAEKCKFPIHVWSWNNSLASEYKQVQRLVYLHRLDPYLDTISI